MKWERVPGRCSGQGGSGRRGIGSRSSAGQVQRQGGGGRGAAGPGRRSGQGGNGEEGHGLRCTVAHIAAAERECEPGSAGAGQEQRPGRKREARDRQQEREWERVPGRCSGQGGSGRRSEKGCAPSVPVCGGLEHERRRAEDRAALGGSAWMCRLVCQGRRLDLCELGAR